MNIRTAGNTIHHAGIKLVELLINVLHFPSIHKANTINLFNVQTNKIFSVINCKPDRLVDSNNYSCFHKLLKQWPIYTTRDSSWLGFDLKSLQFL